MQARILLGVLLLPAVAAQKQSSCNEQLGPYAECVLLHSGSNDFYNQADVVCFAVEKGSSEDLPVLKATMTLRSNLSLWTVREHISGTCAHLRNVSFERCHGHTRNETSWHYAQDVGKLQRIAHFNEHITAQFVECARNQRDIRCNIKMLIPFAVNEDTAKNPNMSDNEPPGTCHVSTEMPVGAIAGSTVVTNFTFLKGHNNLSQILQSQDAFRNATRVWLFVRHFRRKRLESDAKFAATQVF